MQTLSVILTEWADEDHTITVTTYEKGWTWQDFKDSDDTVGLMLDTVDHKVSFILDGSKAVIPKGFSSNFPELVDRAQGLHHPNAEYIVIVGVKPHLQALYELFSSLFKEHSKTTFMVATLDKAKELIKEKRRQAALS